jgi:hypothetical protein
VLSVVLKYHKVHADVPRSIVIDVMDCCPRRQLVTEGPLSNNAMLIPHAARADL